MGQKCDRFQEGVVFRLCIDCRKMVGCWFFGEMNDCAICTKNCSFRGAHISIDGFQLLDDMDANTSSLCEECATAQYKAIEEECPETIISM